MLCSFSLLNTPQILAQKKPTNYEVEILRNIGKDTREFNSKLSFGEDGLKIVSSRDATVYSEMKYSDIQTAEYSYSKKPAVSTATKIIVSAFFPLISLPLYFLRKKIHWMTIKTDSDFAILKLERDNYKQIKAELEKRNIKIENIKE